VNISIQNLNFSFSCDAKPFFKNMNIDFYASKINFICGKNGMGKSTLLKILSGQIQQNIQGSLVFSGQIYDVQKLCLMPETVGMVVQNFNSMLVDSYSFYENLQCALLAQFPSLTSLCVVKQLPQFIDKYGINFDVPISLLSGGQRQILAILMILQKNPKILLLDEPTAALDEENAKIVMDFLQQLSIEQDITIIAIVHDKELVRQYAQNFYSELYQDNDIRKVRLVQV